MTAVETTDLTKSFGSQLAVDGLSLAQAADVSMAKVDAVAKKVAAAA